MSRFGRYAVAYLLLALLAIGVGWGWLDYPLLTLSGPWFVWESPHTVSAGVGVALGLLVVLITRVCVGRFSWAKRLHQDLRPVARGLSFPGVLALALFSSVGEELLFRGVGQPLIGVWLQALVFGVVHYVPGASRWVWASWAALIGLLLGLIFQSTGSLIGPILAHALINGMNLWFLKHHDPEPQPRQLGGLLGQRGL